MKNMMLASIALCLAGTYAHAQITDAQPDCGNAQTQLEMNQCSAMELEAADKALNIVWPKARAAMKSADENNADFTPGEPSAADNLLNAQRAWIDYRDGQCAAEAAQFAGGSIQPLIRNTCLANMTEKRTAELQEMIAER